MTVNIIRPSELDSDLLKLWRNIQSNNKLLMSPYLCPEFVQAVAAVRNDVYLSVIEDNNTVIGFFPFQKSSIGLARPVAGALNDYHGIICEPDYKIAFKEIVASCKLRTFTFHHLLAPNYTTKFYDGIDYSHYIDLEDGYASYEEKLCEKGSKLIKDTRYKLRKLQRDYGEFRFEPIITDKSDLDLLLTWKSSQYVESGRVDIFSYKWTKALLENIFNLKSNSFSGMLSGLYVGNQPIALHMGMRSDKVCNWWFPRHDQRFNKYSPGIILRLLVAEYVSKIGIKRIDLGCGDDTTYKPRLSSGTIPLYSGTIFSNDITKKIYNTYVDMADYLRKSPIKPILRYPVNILRTATKQMKFK